MHRLLSRGGSIAIGHAKYRFYWIFSTLLALLWCGGCEPTSSNAPASAEPDGGAVDQGVAPADAAPDGALDAAPDGALDAASGRPWCLPPQGPRGPLADCDEAPADVDSVDALRAAVAAAQPGTTIRLAAGEYVFEEALNLPRGVHLRGACAALTVIRGPAHDAAFTVLDTGPVPEAPCLELADSDLTVVSGISVRAVTACLVGADVGALALHDFDCADAGVGLRVRGAQRLWLSHIALADTGRREPAAAVEVEDADVSIVSSRLQDGALSGIRISGRATTLEALDVERVVGQGIVVAGDDTSTHILRDIQLSEIIAFPGGNLQSEGIWVSRGEVVMEDVAVRNGGDFGVLLTRLRGNVRRVAIEGSRLANLFIGDREDPRLPLTIEDVTSVGAEAGIMMRRATGRLIRPSVRGASLAGLGAMRCAGPPHCDVPERPFPPVEALDAPAAVDVEGGDFTGNDFGIAIIGDDVRLTDTRVTASPRYGVVAYQGALLRARGLTVQDAGGAAVGVVDGADALAIEDSHFELNRGFTPDGLEESLRVAVLVSEGAASLRRNTFGGDLFAVVATQEGRPSDTRTRLGLPSWLEFVDNEVSASISAYGPEATLGLLYLDAAEACENGCEPIVEQVRSLGAAVGVPLTTQRPMPSAIVPAPAVPSDLAPSGDEER